MPRSACRWAWRTWPEASIAHGLDAAELASQAVEAAPDLLLVHMPSHWSAALAIVASVTARLPGLKVIILDAPEGEIRVLGCVEAGARAALPQSACLDDLCALIRSIGTRETICSPRIAFLMFERLSELAAVSAAADQGAL